MRWADLGPMPGSPPSSSTRLWTGPSKGDATSAQPSAPPRLPRSRPPVTEPIRSAWSSCARRIAWPTAATTRSSSISTSSGSTTSGEILTACTSPAPVTTAVTFPPPADPSTRAVASSSCAAAMSACIFCTWRIIWLSCFWFATFALLLRVAPACPAAATRRRRRASLVLAFFDDGGAQRLGEHARRARRLYSRRGRSLVRLHDDVVVLLLGRGRRRGGRRWLAAEPLVLDEVEPQARSDVARQRLPDRVGFPPEPRTRRFDQAGRHAEGHDVPIDGQGLRLLDGAARRDRQLGEHGRPRQDDIVDGDGRRGRGRVRVPGLDRLGVARGGRCGLRRVDWRILRGVGGRRRGFRTALAERADG